MAANLESGKETQLALPLSTTDTEATLFSVPTKTSGRLYITDGTQEERVNYTGITGSKVTWLTRNLSKTWDPATGGTGLAFIAWSTVRLVVMHDQIVDKTDSNTFKAGTTQTFDAIVSKDVSFTGTTTAWLKLKSLTTAQRTALTGANGMMVYDSDIWVVYQYIAGSRAQVAISVLTPMLLTGDQTASGIKTFSSLLKATDKQQFGGGAEVLDQITMWSAFRYWLWVNGAKTTLFRHGSWSWISFWSYDGTTYTEHAAVNSASDFTFDWGNIRRWASDAEALTGSSTTTVITPYQWTLISKQEVQTFTRSTIGTQTITHSLWKVPKMIKVTAKCISTVWSTEVITSDGSYDGTNQKSVYVLFWGTAWTASNIVYVSKLYSWTYYELIGTIQNVTSTQFEILRENRYANNTYAQSIQGIIEIA